MAVNLGTFTYSCPLKYHFPFRAVSYLQVGGGEWTGYDRVRVGLFTKWVRSSHGWPANDLGRVGLFIQINGLGRVGP